MISEAYKGLRPCLDCGKCTGTCPIARENGGLSPRQLVAERTRQPRPVACVVLSGAAAQERAVAQVPRLRGGPYHLAIWERVAPSAEDGVDERPEVLGQRVEIIPEHPEGGQTLARSSR